MENQQEDKLNTNIHGDNFLHIFPDPPHFGCICVGFSYKLIITLTNHGDGMGSERLNAICKPCEETKNVIKCSLKDIILNKGISTKLELDLIAESDGAYSYELIIKQKSGHSIVRIINAFILPKESFKSLTKALSLDNRKIYEIGVKLVGYNNPDESSVSSESLHHYSSAFLDDDDLEDISDLPFLEHMYYNPYEKTLCSDDILLKVEINEKLSVAEAVIANQSRWNGRLAELEEKGMLTKRVMAKVMTSSRRSLASYSPVPVVDSRNSLASLLASHSTVDKDNRAANMAATKKKKGNRRGSPPRRTGSPTTSITTPLSHNNSLQVALDTTTINTKNKSPNITNSSRNISKATLSSGISGIDSNSMPLRAPQPPSTSPVNTMNTSNGGRSSSLLIHNSDVTSKEYNSTIRPRSAATSGVVNTAKRSTKVVFDQNEGMTATMRRTK